MSPPSSDRAAGVGVALTSVCLLTTEVALTRLFSVTIWYHFAFLAISVALFGTGVASISLHLLERRLPARRTGDLLAFGAIALGLSSLLSTWTLLHFTPDVATGADFDLLSATTRDLVITFAAAALPFLIGGFVIALAMTRFSRAIHSLYSWDLAGAALGCLLVIPALGLLGAPLTLVAAGAVAAAGAVSFARLAIRRRALFASGAVACAALFALAFTGPTTGLFELRFAKGLRLDRMEIELNRWNSFSMVSVLGRGDFRGWGMSPAFTGELPDRRTLVIDMNAMTPLLRFDGDLEAAGHVGWDLSAFVHHVRPGAAPEAVCVIGAGGGRDVLAALVGGARRVWAVEINPIITDDVMRGAYRDFTGGLYARPDVEIATDDGRGFIRRSERRYDIIHLSMVDTSAATAAGAYSLTENSLHTAQAFADYLDHLREDGLLSISSVTMPGLAGGAGLSALAWKALRDRGADPSRCVIVVTTPWIGRPGCTLHNIIVKPTPFTAAELARVEEAARRLRFELAYVPGTSPRRGSWIGEILTAKDDASFVARAADWPLDVTPATDDRPYFFYQNRLADLLEMLATSKPGYLFGNGLFVIAKVALVAIGMVLLFIALPLIVSRRELDAGGGSRGVDLAYVACLGTGFMCVEIALIQKFTLLLGRPTYTLAAVLLAILIGGAIGSRLSGRMVSASPWRRLPIAIGALVLLLAGAWLTGAGDALLDAGSAWPFTARAVLTFAVLVPTGVLLGMPYPAGLLAISKRAPGRIPWMWGVNSATSVLGSVTAVIVSMNAGISTTLLVGAAIYAVALLLARKVAGPR